jgi:hypothetical protein
LQVLGHGDTASETVALRATVTRDNDNRFISDCFSDFFELAAQVEHRGVIQDAVCASHLCEGEVLGDVVFPGAHQYYYSAMSSKEQIAIDGLLGLLARQLVRLKDAQQRGEPIDTQELVALARAMTDAVRTRLVVAEKQGVPLSAEDLGFSDEEFSYLMSLVDHPEPDG